MMKMGGFNQGFLKSPGLGQSGAPQIATRSAATGGGEPDLNRALSSLSADEAAEYKNWNSAHKTLFLMGYQWLAVAAAKNLQRLDDQNYTGFFQQGLDIALGAMGASAVVADSLPDAAGMALSDATSALKEATDKTMPRLQAAVKRYRFLRDRVAWELAAEGDTVEYEIVGDDGGNPGIIFTKRMGGGSGAPDVDAVFSKMAPKQAVNEGDSLEEMYAGLGVPFQRLDLSGINLGDVGTMPVLALVITLVVGVLSFYYLYGRSTERAKLNDAVINAILKDQNLSAEQKADLVKKIQESESFFGTILGPTFSWTTVIVGGTILGLAFFVLPKLLANMKEEKK
jgi:hypothetical protein